MNERIAKLANESGFDVDKSGAFGNYSEMHRIEQFVNALIKDACVGISVDDAVEIYEKYGLEYKPTMYRIPDYADVYTVEEFEQHVNSGAITDYDGSGYWATEKEDCGLSVWSTVKPEWATHVTWYNK
jgi:hypothetical protein